MPRSQWQETGFPMDLLATCTLSGGYHETYSSLGITPPSASSNPT